MENRTIRTIRRKNKGCGAGDKHSKLVDYLNGVREEEFTGYIKVNYSQGNIGRIEKFEEILRH
ncbi:hypothetical protein ACOHYD_12225 [Desulfobacterota bacterium M19]